MPYTFGAANNNTINPVTTQANIFLGSSANLICMWFYPTSLTSGRYLWGYVDTNLANGNGVTIDTTTTRLRYVTSAGGVQILTGAENITINRWWFLAVFISKDSGTGADILRAWLGNETSPPIEMSVSVTSSAIASTALAISIGNGGSGSLSFIGDIGQTTFLSQRIAGASATAGGIFPLASLSSIQQQEADFIYERWVKYFWLGQPRFNYLMSPSKTITNNLDIVRSYYIPMNGNHYYRYFSDSTTGSTTTTFTQITGAVLSDNREPNVITYNWLNNDKFIRRR